MVYNYNKHYFDNIDSAEKAYWLGFLWADGCLFNSKTHPKHVIFSLHKKDRLSIKTLLNALESNHPIRTQKNKYDRVEFYGADFYDSLFQKGFEPLKSKLNRIPKFPSRYDFDFIRGVFDGDGCVYYHQARNQTCVEIAGNFKIVDYILNVMQFGTCSRMSLKGTWRWRASGNQVAKRFAQNIYYDNNIICMKRKREKFKRFINV